MPDGRARFEVAGAPPNAGHIKQRHIPLRGNLTCRNNPHQLVAFVSYRLNGLGWQKMLPGNKS
jgi:hypothetical protein